MTQTVYSYHHIVVVHGIGDQAPNETALGFMNEFIRALPRKDGELEPIVYNLVESVDALTTPPANASAQSPPVRRAFEPAFLVFVNRCDPHRRQVHVIGFSEVYWQPITNFYLEKNGGNLPIPVFTWARTIPTRLLGPGYQQAQWRAAIENVETILKLLKSLTALSKKTNVFVEITEKFLGDVQMYAESDEIRQQINAQFFRVLGRVKDMADKTRDRLLSLKNRKDLHMEDFDGFKEFDERKIFVVAHSEGTVVAYNSLVQAAMIGEGPNRHGGDPEYKRAAEAEGEVAKEVGSNASDWLPQVAGLLTFGSPLDKHYLIWRTRFRKDCLQEQRPQKILWFNYADVSDPVAYNLEELLPGPGKPAETDAVKMFNIADDRFFTRYPLPGKAHVDYWNDRTIYEQVIYRMMKLAPGTPAPLSNAWWAGLQPLGDYVGYVVGRVLTFCFALYFLNRLLSFGALDLLRAWAPLAEFHAMMTAQPFGGGSLILNYAAWLLGPLAAMKLLVEAEQGWLGRAWPRVLRWTLGAAWGVVLLLIALFMQAGEASSGFQDLLGNGTGLVITLLVWKLHTAIHRGLVQLWRYTKVL